MADDLDDVWWEKSKKNGSKKQEEGSDGDNVLKKKSKTKDKEKEKKRDEKRVDKDRSRDKHRQKEKSKHHDGSKSEHRDKSNGKNKSRSKSKEKKDQKRRKDSDSDSEPDSKKKKSDSDSETSKKESKKKKSSDSESESEDDEETMGTVKELMEALRRQFFGLLTPVEEEEMAVPEKSFCACRQGGESQTEYLSKQIKDWDQRVESHKRKSAPIIMIVCASGVRSVDLKRELADFLGKNCKTAKLFSKHMKVSVKIEEQEKYLKSHVVHLGVGTPHRLRALLELGALSLSELTHVFVDWNWRDQKRRRLVDVSEVRCELNNLLRAQIIPHLRSHPGVKLGLL